MVAAPLLDEAVRGWTHSYRIDASLDGRPWRTLSFDTAPAVDRSVRVDGRRAVIGEPEARALELPPGAHALALRPSADMLVRVIEGDGSPVLAGGPNGSVPALDAATEAAIDRAQALTRDNGWRASALGASAELRRHLAASPVPGRLAAAAARLRAGHARFRDLLPAGSGAPLAQAFAYVRERRLLDPVEPPPGPFGRPPPQLPAALRGAAADAVTGARFVRAGSGDELSFALPARDGPSRLRVLAASGLRGPLELRLDGAAPLSLEVVDDDALLAPDMAAAGPGLAAIAALPRLSSGFDGGTTGGPFASRRPPGPLARAGSAVVALPAGVRTVKLRAVGGGPSYVAVQVLAATPFDPPGDEYAALLAEVGGEGTPGPAQELFTSTLARAVEILSRDTEGAYCGASVVAPERAAGEQALVNAWMEAFRALASRYRELIELAGPDPEVAGGAPQAWSWCRGATSDDEVDTCLGRIDALTRDGERNLARRLLAAVALRSPARRVRAEAAQRLRALALAAQDWDGLLGATVASALEQAAPAALPELVTALHQAGEHEAAARAGALVEPSSPARQAALLSAAAMGDAFLVRYLARDLPEEGRRLWEGHACQIDGDVGGAIASYDAAGPAGAAWAERSRQGVRIRDELASADPARRARAVDAWAGWLARDGGEVAWFDASHLVTASAGGAAIYAPSRDAHALAYSARPELPVRLLVAGPAHLRVEARPLLPRADESFAGWLEIRDGKDELSVPVDSTPSASLTVVGEGALVGTAAAAVVAVPAGVRELAIRPTQGRALVRVALERPMVPVAALPPATPAAISAALAGRWKTVGAPAEACRWCFDLVDAGSAVRLDAHRETEPIEAPPPAAWRPADPGRLALVTAGHDVSQLLGEFERGGPGADAALARAGRIRLEHLDDPVVGAAWDRMQAASAWEPLEPDASAGFRDVRVGGANVEGPRLRARTELLPALAPGAQVLFGSAPVSLDLGVPSPTTVVARLSHVTVPTHAPVARTVLFRVDDGRERSVALDGGGAGARVEVELAPGGHRLTFRLERALPNRYVQVTLERKGAGAALAVERERRYWIATRAEPVSVGVPGPAWIRVDELVGERLRSSERYVPASLERLDLRPADGREQALFRVQRLVRAPPLDPRRPPPEPRAPVSAPPPAPVAADAPPSAAGLVVLRDAAPAEDGWGTWTVGTAFSRARLEESDATGVDERFGPFATWRRLERWRGLHEQIDVAARVHDAGPASFGAAGRLELASPDSFLGLRAATSLFAQGPAVAWAGRVAVEARVQQSGRTSQALALEVFGRALGGWDEQTTDPDVYTPYADRHRYGAELSYALVHRPWLDTRGALLASVVTNPGFASADRAGAAARVDQRLGPVAVGLHGWVSRWFGDEARLEALTRAGLGALVSWDVWAGARRRVELRAALERRLPDGAWLGGIELAWHLSGGVDDFAPRDRPFLELDRLRGAQRTGSELILDAR